MRERVDAFLGEVSEWAARMDDVHAVVLLGSHARAHTPADEVSDVDLALFVDDPARYVGEATWVDAFGEPLLAFVEPTAVGGFEERRVLYRDGLEVDFSILPVATATSLPAGAARVLARGWRVLYDDGIAVGALDDRPGASPAPTQAQFDQLANDFWFHLLWAAKKLWRGELLLAKQVCDCGLTDRLVELVRWRAHGRDTWHGLRFFERWAGDDAVEALAPTFARYDADDVERALRATADLFGRIEDEVAQRFGLTPPEDRAEVLRRLDAVLAP